MQRNYELSSIELACILLAHCDIEVSPQTVSEVSVEETWVDVVWDKILPISQHVNKLKPK